MLVAMGNGDEQARPPGPPPIQGFSFHQQVIIRVTPVPRPGGNRISQSAQTIEWRESGGPRCVPVRAILGAAQISQDSIDLIRSMRHFFAGPHRRYSSNCFRSCLRIGTIAVRIALAA